MAIHLTARQRFTAPAAAAFALSIDARRFPALFPGYGPIPAIRRVELQGIAAVGTKRQIHNSDGSVLDEEILQLDAPHRHRYRLGGFRAPFAWLVREGEADWQFRDDGAGTTVEWHYRFEPASTLAQPFAALLLHGFMQRAMQRCLGKMSEALDAAGNS